ncbi:hypothetical protein MFLO_04205 [Listeria floridensis FSL S10-1187]|uniref:Phage protein n=1 Tax=Listeria floridensis FSL S10-1187 TaxID=1265817 RepID=A0ABP3B1T8_9LIST|nr:hypothetical protein [Listeria floridensis]EUJ33114.1 hypothetical protein MFLO_04205 [Listeria floridensis FSL S10-1187]
MATKSFYTEFKLNTKAGNKLANAVDNSRRVDLEIKKPVRDVNKKEELDRMMESFFSQNKGK